MANPNRTTRTAETVRPQSLDTCRAERTEWCRKLREMASQMLARANELDPELEIAR